MTENVQQFVDVATGYYERGNVGFATGKPIDALRLAGTNAYLAMRNQGENHEAATEFQKAVQHAVKEKATVEKWNDPGDELAGLKL